MSLNQWQQIAEAIGRAKNILIVFHGDAGGDAAGSGLALSKLLNSLDKKTTVRAVNWRHQKQYAFLPKCDEFKCEPECLQKFVIKLDASKTPVKELIYDLKEGKTLEIHITPKQGFYSAKDVTTETGGFNHDLIICLDTPDLESLGELYEHNTDFFYQVPIINIDHQPHNENFGQINYIDLTACSVAEMIYELYKKLKPEALDQEVATALLTGIISKTKNFRATRVTPQCLSAVSELINAGAEREKIVGHLYWSRSVQTIQLWGRVLARLRQADNLPLVWSRIGPDDFQKTGTQEVDLADVIDELIATCPEAKVIALFYEYEPKKTKALVSAHYHYNATEICRAFGATGSKQLASCEFTGQTLQETETKVLEHLKKTLSV